jgi:hypothetical protein
MKVSIKFTDDSGFVPPEFHPTPAKQSLPDWYARLKPFGSAPVPKENKQTSKRCVPMLDSFTAGYILYTPVDIEVSINEDGKYNYRWAHQLAVEFLQPWQAGNHALVDEHYQAIPKMPNPWGVKTPSGYSCLYVPPVNRDDAIFEIFSGVVDTDKFHQGGSLPFLFKEKGFEGIIPAGTPMAQVIPFRRESYEMKIGDDSERTLMKKQFNAMRLVFVNGYRKMFWSPKSYK